MIQYIVRSCGNSFKIEANEIEWGANGLKFLRNNEVIALFMTWDYWYQGTGILLDKES